MFCVCFEIVSMYNIIIYFAHRNLPQFIIQLIYCFGYDNIDIFVINAMLFSTLSMIIHLLYSLSRRWKKNTSAADDVISVEMTIECSKMKKYHAYTHNVLTHAICSALKIDETGNIQVFYIVHKNTSLIAHIDISDQAQSLSQKRVNISTQESLLKKIAEISVPGSMANQAFIQQLSESLKFNAKGIVHPITVTLKQRIRTQKMRVHTMSTSTPSSM